MNSDPQQHDKEDPKGSLFWVCNLTSPCFSCSCLSFFFFLFHRRGAEEEERTALYLKNMSLLSNQILIRFNHFSIYACHFYYLQTMLILSDIFEGSLFFCFPPLFSWFYLFPFSNKWPLWISSSCGDSLAWSSSLSLSLIEYVSLLMDPFFVMLQT